MQKKLLFVSAFPPNSKSGGQIFSLNLLKDLSSIYIVDLIYFTYKNHSIDESLNVNSIRSFGVDNLNCLRNCTKHPLFTRRFNRNILNYLANIASNYDILFFDYTQTGLYSLYINHTYKIIRCHDILFQKFSRENKIFKYWVKSTEKKILNSAQKVFVPSEKDAGIVKAIYGITPFFTHEYIKNFSCDSARKITNTFVFFGIWSRKENLDGLLWFIKYVYPLINSALNIQFIIIGGGLSLKAQQKYVAPYRNIEYAGFAENPLDIIYASRALIAPLFTGAGVKVKVIDAFTTGTPVIGTDITFEGLPFIKKLVYHADTPQEYATTINNFCTLSFEEKKRCAKMFRDEYDTHHLAEQVQSCLPFP